MNKHKNHFFKGLSFGLVILMMIGVLNVRFVRAEETPSENATSEVQPSETGDSTISETPETENAPAEAEAPVVSEEPEKEATPLPLLAPPTPAEKTWVDGSAGDDATGEGTEAKPFKTFAKALANMAEDGAVHVKGDFFTANFVMDKRGTVIIEDDVNMTGSGIAIHLKAAGASITVKEGKTLRIHKYNKGIEAAKDTVISDGNYAADFPNNGFGFVLTGGKIQGSSAGKVVFSIVNGYFQSITATSEINNAHIDQKYEGGKWQLYEWNGFKASHSVINTYHLPFYFRGPLMLDDTRFSINGAGLNYQTGVNMDNSWTVGGYHFTNGSVFEVKNFDTHWRSKGITLGYGSQLLVDNQAKIVTTNNNNGGLNINDGHVVFDNAIFESSQHRGAQFGVQTGSILFKGNTVVNTPAAGGADNGICKEGQKFIVLGGSHKVKYHPGMLYSLIGSGMATPTNGDTNGNESLMLFRLKDPSLTELHPLNINGNTYLYPVANPSDDQQKYVWTPAAKVIFQLQNSSAKHADGTTADKNAATIRGYKLADVVGNETLPGTPIANVPFLGWFYKDASGVEKEFDPTAVLTNTSTLTVYAKWDVEYVLNYHNNQSSAAVYTEPFASGQKPTAPKSYAEIAAANSAFTILGQEFVKWTYDAAGNQEINGDLHFDENTKTCNLYAQYTPIYYTVTFSANGGTFTDDSIFKKNPHIFTIEQDENGGEVARIRDIQYGKRIGDLIKPLSTSSLVAKHMEKVGFNLVQNTWYSGKKDGSAVNFGGFFGANPAVKENITYYAHWQAIDPLVINNVLPGDLLIGDNSENHFVFPMIDGQAYAYTGALDITQIKNIQLTQVESLFPAAAGHPENIDLKNLSSEFVAEFRLPAHMQFVETPTKDNVLFDGKGVFKVAQVTLNENRLRVQLLLDETAFPNFDLLKKGIQRLDDVLKVTLPGIATIPAETTDGELLKLVGELTGKMEATAIYNGTVKNFDFSWTGIQEPTTADVQAPNAPAISFTSEVAKPQAFALLGDLRIAQNTEHLSVHAVTNGEELNYTGQLNIEPIQNQIRLLKDQYGGDYTTITVNNIQSEFVAELTIPSGLEIPTVLSSHFTDNELFEMEPVSVHGNKIQVKMKLKKNYTHFKDLYEDVLAVRPLLHFTVDKLKVKTNNASNQKQTVIGKVEGTFKGIAIAASGNVQVYNFKWIGVQDPAGKDYFQDPMDNDTIAYSVVVRRLPTKQVVPNTVTK